MQQIFHIVLLILLTGVAGMDAHAQRTTFIDFKEDPAITVAPGRVKIIVYSNSDKMTMQHSSGEEEGVKTAAEDGTFCYTIDYAFPEDYEDEFIKTTLILRLPAGQEEAKLTLWEGKAYVGTFNENFLTIERNGDRVYPESKAAKVTFLSEVQKLTIECNGAVCFSNGEAVTMNGTNMTASINRDGVLTEYSIAFSLDEAMPTTTFVKHPVFNIKVDNRTAIPIDLGGDLEYKKSYSYTVVSNVKVIEKELSFDEVVAKAVAKENESDFFAAANAWEDARSHVNCPIDRRGELEERLGKMSSARRFLFYAEKFERQGARIEREEGFTADSVFVYLRGAIRAYQKVLEYAPGASIYAERITTLDTKLDNHPLNMKEDTVLVQYQVITGKHPGGGGIPIYASATEKKPKTNKKDEPLGLTRDDGSFRLVFETAPPAYLYFFGDKESYAISSTTTEIVFE